MFRDDYFNEEVSNQLDHYVYRLIDPRNGETFYVGQGQGNRVFSHIKDELVLDPEVEDEVSEKIGRIREIRNSGLQVIHVIHRHGMTKEVVNEVEAALIDAFPGLSNIQGGHGSFDRGPMRASQINEKYGLDTIDSAPQHNLLLICVNRYRGASRNDLYQQVRFAWKLSLERANKADYVLAVVQGVVKGVFAGRWERATRGNFPDIPVEEPTRAGFVGEPAEEDIWHLYVGERGKRIALDELRHSQNPVKYWEAAK